VEFGTGDCGCRLGGIEEERYGVPPLPETPKGPRRNRKIERTDLLVSNVRPSSLVNGCLGREVWEDNFGLKLGMGVVSDN
jgi:hypothetical protein